MLQKKLRQAAAAMLPRRAAAQFNIECSSRLQLRGTFVPDSLQLLPVVQPAARRLRDSAPPRLHATCPVADSAS